MSFIPPLPRSHPLTYLAVGEGQQQAIPQAFIDKPEIDYDGLIKAINGINNLGKIDGELNVGIVGVGCAGSLIAWQLATAGAKVKAYERGHEAGGRFYSIEKLKLIFEIGAMRFPPCETVMYHLAEILGFGFIQDFPDPGKVPTLISRDGESVLWVDPSNPPAMAAKIVNAFVRLETHGVTRDGESFLCSFNEMQGYLKSSDRNTRLQVIPHWQRWIDTFRGDTFLSGLRKIFGSNHLWDWPTDQILSDEDFRIFGDVGFGSGGFRDLFDRDFCYITKLLPNGLETKQATFAKKNGDKLTPHPVQDLVRAIWAKATDSGAVGHFNTEVTDVVAFTEAGTGKAKFRVEYKDGNGSSASAVHDVVILTTTIKVDLMQNLAKRTGDDALFSPEVCEAVLNLDLIPSTKLFDVIDDFTENLPVDYPRVVLNDKLPGQVYTLKYEPPRIMAALKHYGWIKGSTDVENLSAEDLDQIVIARMTEITQGTQWADLPEHLRSHPHPEGLKVKFDWQKHPSFNGAFVLAAPGQQRYSAALGEDFLKARDPTALRIYIAGDNAAQESGWGDGAFRIATDVSGAIIASNGVLNHGELQAINAMTQGLYRY